MVQEPPITTKTALKQAVASAQVGLLQFARMFNNPPAVATAGLGALQKEELETRRKTNRQFMEALNRYAPPTASTVDERRPWS